jgi:hypothetical protein
MASSGSINTSSYEGRYLQLSWTQTKDVANNRSTIKWTLSSIGGTEVYYSTGATTVKINGTQVYYKDRMDWTTYAFPAAKGSVSGTTTINHASDGTGSIKVELSTAIWYYAIDSYSKSWTLDTIPRASTPTLSASSVNIGSAVTINTNRASSAFTHTIRYEWAGTSGTIATGVGSSYSWTIPTSFASNIPNATSGTCKVYVDTYNGSTKIGTKSVNLTAKVPDADWTKPKINSVTISPSGNPDWVGSRYVQSKTKARVVTGTTGQAGATIKTCEVTIDGTKYTGTDITSNAIRNSGTVSATVKVTDSRGYTNSTTKNISVESYSKPYIAKHSTQSKIICARCNDSGTLVSNGTRLRLMLSKKWSALSGSVNTALVQYQINSNSWVTASAHTTNASDIALTVTNITLNVKQTYKVSIKITDKFGETDTYQYDIPTEEITFNLKEGGNGASFGKYAEKEDMLDIAWDTNIDGDLTLGGKDLLGYAGTKFGWGKNNVIYNAQTVANSSGNTITGASVDLAANSTYLVLVGVMASNGDQSAYSDILLANVESGGEILISCSGRSGAYAGGGVCGFGIVKTTSATFARCQSHGYKNAAFNLYMRTVAIKLDS